VCSSDLHIAEGGRFWVTAHNPAARRSFYDGRVIDLGHHALRETDEVMHVTGAYTLDESTGVATGIQMYHCTRGDQVTREVELPMRFHLIPPAELEELLGKAGWRVEERFGNYDRSAFDPERSPFFIVSCSPR
jgi:hypothetical protein